MANPNERHKFEPKMFQGRKQLSCDVCGYMEDAAIHNDPKPEEAATANVEELCVDEGCPHFGTLHVCNPAKEEAASAEQRVKAVYSTAQLASITLNDPNVDVVHIKNGYHYYLGHGLTEELAWNNAASYLTSKPATPKEEAAGEVSLGFEKWWHGGEVTELVEHLEGEDDPMECYKALSRHAWEAAKVASLHELQQLRDVLGRTERDVVSITNMLNYRVAACEKAESELQRVKAEALESLKQSHHRTQVALAEVRAVTEKLKQAQEELAAMTEDRNLWRDDHNRDCPNVNRVTELEAELRRREGEPNK